MTGVIAGLALLAIGSSILAVIGAVVAAPDDDTDSPGPDASDAQASVSRHSPAGGAASLCRGWLPATLPAIPSPVPAGIPRICAGRVARVQQLLTLTDTAGWPVASYHAGVRWPAQEGIA